MLSDALHRLVFATVAIVAYAPTVQAGDEVRIALQVVSNRGSMEPLNLRALFPGCTQVGAVGFVGGQFQITLTSTPCGVPVGGQWSQDFTLGRLPQGRYAAQMYSDGASPVPIGQEIAIEVATPVQPGNMSEPRGLLDHSGVWWSRQRNGEAFLIQHETANDQLLITWNRFKADGNPEWLVAVSERQNDFDYECVLYRPSPTGLQRVGKLWFGDSISVAMDQGPDIAEVNVDMAGESHTIVLERYRYSK